MEDQYILILPSSPPRDRWDWRNESIGEIFLNADFGFLFIEEEEENNDDRLEKKEVVVGMCY